MPRTITKYERATAKGPDYNLSTLVEVMNPNGVWQNLQTLGGVDWFDKATWRDAIDNPTMEGTLGLVREDGILSLAPFLTQTPLNRPVNLLINSEGANSAGWSTSGMSWSLDSIIAPDGTQTADKVIPTAANTFHYQFEAITHAAVTNDPFTASAHFRAAELTTLCFLLTNGNTSAYGQIAVNLSTLAVTITTVGGFSQVVGGVLPAANGFFRLWVSGLTDTAGNGVTLQYWPGTLSSGNVSAAFNGTDGLYVWGAMITPTYTPTAAALAPYVKTGGTALPGTYTPVLDAARGVRVSVATTQPGLAPGTNLLKQSESFTSAPWTAAAGGTGGVVPTVTPNFGVAPDGSTTATRVQFDKGTGAASSQLFQAFTVLVGQTVTTSLWIKLNSGSGTILLRNLMAAVNGNPGDLRTLITPTGTWTRYSLTGVAAITGATWQLLLWDAGGTSNTIDVQIWGGMADPSSTLNDYVATTTVAGLTSYKEVFLGMTAAPDWGGRDSNAISLTIRDVGYYLVSKWSQTDVVYGSTGGTSLETVIQQILDANINPKFAQFATGSNGINSSTGAITLFTPVATGITVNQFTFPAGSVLIGLRTLVATMGWDIKFRYDAAGNFRLTLFLPPRGKVTIDDTFDGDEYFEVPRLGLLDDDVRNILDLFYKDKAAGTMLSVSKTNSASVTAFGPRYHRIALDTNSPVNTNALATTLATAIDSDLATPYAQQDMETAFAWWLTLHDLYAYLPNTVLYDVTQNLAVVGLTWTLDRSDGTTTATTRGQVAGLYHNWINREPTIDLQVGPSLDVISTPGSPNYSITYTGNVAPDLSISGGTYAPAPASPITVARPAAGAAALQYTFRAVLNGQVVTDMVTIQPIDQDTVTPDVSAVPGNYTATTQDFTVATNAATGPAPTLTVTMRGTTATGSVSGAFADGVPKTASSGEVITANRPAFGTVTQASMEVRGTVVASERIYRTILNQVSLGPSLDVKPTPGPTSYSIAWTGSGTLLAIDGGTYSTPPASPITVTRPAAGQPSTQYSFRNVLDGQTVTNDVTIPSLDKDTATPDLVVSSTAQTSTNQSFSFSATNPSSGGATPTITVEVIGGTLNGGALGPGTVYSAPNPGTVVADRPAFGTAAQMTVIWRATIAGQGTETIQRTIQNQVSLGPSLQVKASHSATQTRIDYTASPAAQMAIDAASYSAAPASPIIVTRDGAAHVYSFQNTLDGQSLAFTVDVSALTSVAKRLTVSPSQFITSTGAPYSLAPGVLRAGSGAGVSQTFLAFVPLPQGVTITKIDMLSKCSVAGTTNNVLSLYRETAQSVTGAALVTSATRTSVNLDIGNVDSSGTVSETVSSYTYCLQLTMSGDTNHEFYAASIYYTQADATTAL